MAHPDVATCNGTWVGALALAYTASKGLQLTYRYQRMALLLLLCLSLGTTDNRRLFEIRYIFRPNRFYEWLTYLLCPGLFE